MHFEVVEVNKRQGLLRLRAALRADVELLLPWRALRERHAWQPGWCSVVEPAPAPAPHEPVPPAPKRDASGDDVVGQSDPA